MNAPSARLLRATSFSFLLLRNGAGRSSIIASTSTITSNRIRNLSSLTDSFVPPPPLLPVPLGAHPQRARRRAIDQLEGEREVVGEGNMPVVNLKLGFIGAGMMASAMINAIIAAKVCDTYVQLQFLGVLGISATSHMFLEMRLTSTLSIYAFLWQQ